MLTGLEERTRAAFPDDLTATHLDYVELWQASGKTLNRLADELSAPVEPTDGDDSPDYDSPPADPLAGIITGEMISRYLDREFGPDEANRRLVAARKRGAHRMNDEALSIADSVKHKDDVPAARLQVSARNWTCERWNREAFGQSRSGDTFNVLSLGQLHLAALRSFAPQPTTPQLGNGNGGSGENA